MDTHSSQFGGIYKREGGGWGGARDRERLGHCLVINEYNTIDATLLKLVSCASPLVEISNKLCTYRIAGNIGGN